jgi:hypothetical protein
MEEFVEKTDPQNVIECYKDGSFCRLSWSLDGTVRLAVADPVDASKELSQIFEVPADHIRRSLIADGSTGLYIWIGDTEYQLFVVPTKTVTAGAYVADAVIDVAVSEMDVRKKLASFHKYLKGYGVKTQRSSLVKIILLTVVSFIVVLALLVTWLLSVY